MAFSNIDKPSKYFNTITWTGNGNSTRSLTGVGFKPDFLWVKCRNQGTFSHTLSDAVRGSTKTLFSNLTNAEVDTYTYGYVTSYDTDGFSATAGASSIEQYNTNNDTYVGWNWLASNTAGSSNTQGTITSTVSANTTSGFSIVSYTATSGTSSIGHGLGVVPSMIILKTRNQTGNWVIGLAVNGWDKYLTLDTTNANVTDDRMFSPSAGTDPTSTLFWSNQSAIGSAGTMIAYCFAEVKGFSKFGSYTGNGSTDGTFVYTGFKPKFFLAKRTDTTNSWTITNSSNQSYNQADTFLLADSSQAESTATSVDYLSNGVKIRSTGAWGNASGGTYIYMAFAENPFVSSKGIPCTAR